MSDQLVNILEGNTFVVSDRRGDLEATPVVNHGLFLNDTRFLSRWVLTVNGLRPKLLSVDDLAFFWRRQQREPFHLCRQRVVVDR